MIDRRHFIAAIPAITGMLACRSAHAAGAPAPAPADAPSGAPSAEWARIQQATPVKEHEKARKLAAGRRAADPRPNILLVWTDQQTFDAMSCAGNPHVRTPNMDCLARRGTRFARCYCQSPVCGPSRASLLTGRMPHETGVRHNDRPINESLPNVGQMLGAAGYDTTWVGKWHLPKSYPREAEIPGFRNLPLPEDLKGGWLGDATDMQNAQAAAEYLRYHAGLSSRPWFLGVALHNPHDICLYFHPADSRVSVREPDADLPPAGGPPPPELPANFAKDPAEPEMLQQRRGQGEMRMTPSLSAIHWRKYLQTYYHMTQAVDRCLRPVLEGLEQGGWSDNTLVIFTSDHGEGMASHEWFTKLSFYEPVVRVPLIVVPPGGFKSPAPRLDRTSLTSLVDLLPTILDYAEVPAEKRPAALRGRSLRRLVGAEADGAGGDFAVAHLDIGPDRPECTARMLVTADGWKYCRFSHGARPEQLFDLNADPGETRNLADDPSAAAAKQRLRQLLREWCKDASDPFLEVLT